VKRILLWGGAAVLVAIAALFLSGSLVWYLLGFSDDLSIEGRAEIIAGAEPVGIGQGWPAYGGDPGGNRYSALKQIDRSNVASLKPAWTYRTRAFEGREDVIGRTAFEATPILAENRLYLCSPFNEAIALDPASGAELWRFDAKIDKNQRPGNQFVCRGVSYWRNTEAETIAACASRIFMATNDGRLIALDPATGTPCPGFGTNGEIAIPPSMDLRWPGEYQITSAPAVIGNVVVVGSAISDNLRVEAPRGAVQAFDAVTGARLWSFDPIPRDASDPERPSWGGNSADVAGHANVWSTISVDVERGWVFLPTSSPSPDFFGGLRPGDNRYANSVVALEAATGTMVWSFQTVHHDVWDYDLPAQPGLYSIWQDGRRKDVVVQAAKTGLVFVLDRDTGEPVFPVEERPVPQGGAPGEILSPTQPFPANPPIVPDTLTAGEAFGVTGLDKAACAGRIAKARSEGLFTPPIEQGTIVRPFTGGGANWGSTAFDPARNLLVVNMNNLAHLIALIPADKVMEVAELMHDAEISPQEGAPFGMSRELLLSPLGLPCSPPPWGVLAGVDLGTGEIVWRRPIGSTRDIAPMGLDMPLGTPNLGGPLATAGDLVFLGATIDSYLRAFDVETGKELWKASLPASAQATPMTYEADGKQFVVFAAGGYGNVDSRMGDFVVAFALPVAQN
jgi:quinoprotein glucose dehydrogenase